MQIALRPDAGGTRLLLKALDGEHERLSLAAREVGWPERWSAGRAPPRVAVAIESTQLDPFCQLRPVHRSQERSDFSDRDRLGVGQVKPGSDPHPRRCGGHHRITDPAQRLSLAGHVQHSDKRGVERLRHAVAPRLDEVVSFGLAITCTTPLQLFSAATKNNGRHRGAEALGIARRWTCRPRSPRKDKVVIPDPTGD